VKKATGTIKEKAGKVIGDRHLESEGKPRTPRATFGAASAKRGTRSERSSIRNSRRPGKLL
jgi:hypothetical protein